MIVVFECALVMAYVPFYIYLNWKIPSENEHLAHHIAELERQSAFLERERMGLRVDLGIGRAAMVARRAVAERGRDCRRRSAAGAHTKRRLCRVDIAYGPLHAARHAAARLA